MPRNDYRRTACDHHVGVADKPGIRPSMTTRAFLESWPPEPCSLAVGEARWDEMCLSLWQYFRAMADPSIRESQLSARPWMAVGGFQFGLEEIADLAK